MLDIYIKVFDYGLRNLHKTTHLLEKLKDCGLDYFNYHIYGVNCFEPVYVYFLGLLPQSI